MKRAGFWRSFRAKPRLQKGAERGRRNKAVFCAPRVVAHGNGQRIGAGAPLLVRAGVAAQACRPKPAKAAPGQAGQARKQRPVLLQKQERIQSPENGSIARFDGLGRYQSRSKKAGAFFYCRAVRTLAGAVCGWLARQGLMSSPPRRV